MNLSIWRESVRELLGEERGPKNGNQAAVAEKLNVSATTFNRYLKGTRGKRALDAREIHRINAAVAEVLGDDGIRSYLDAQAATGASAGRVSAVLGALEVLGAHALVPDWQRRLAAWAEAHDNAACERLERAILSVQRKALRNAVAGRIPARSGAESLARALGPFGLAGLLSEGLAYVTASEQLSREIRRVLTTIADPSATAAERLEAERRLFSAALKYVPQIQKDIETALRSPIPPPKARSADALLPKGRSNK